MKCIYNPNITPLYSIFIFILIFYQISSTKSEISNYLKLPLKIIGFPSSEELYTINEENLLIKLSKIRIQTNLILGSNKQVLPADISFEHYPVYISSILCSENIPKFNYHQSTSFIDYNKIDGNNLNQNCLKCNISKDNFYLDNDKNIPMPISFILGTMLSFNYDKISAEIGFKPTKPKTDPSVLNILLQLKKVNFISNKNFMLHFNPSNNIGENKGDLLLGAFPEKFHQNLEKFKYFYISAENGNIEDWQFILDNSYYGKKYINEKNKVYISLKDYFIHVPYYIKKILDEDFFKELYDSKKCDYINLNKTSSYFYICDDTIDINQMKDFRFYPTNLNEPIELTFSPNDLFYKFGKNKLLYLIAFNYNIDYWKFNVPFILKYQPIFDIDNKIISIYNNLNTFNESDFVRKNDININKDKTKKESNLLKNIFFFFLYICLILIILIILKKGFDYYKIRNLNQEHNKNEKILEFKDMSFDYNDTKDDKDDNKTNENKLIS